MDINNLAVNTIRVLSAEAIQKANSGNYVQNVQNQYQFALVENALFVAKF